MTLGDLENVEVGEFLFLLFAILFGILIIVALFYKYATWKRKTDDEACPIREAHVRVVHCDALQANAIPQWSSVNVVFETDSGERVRFVVMASENYLVGDCGTLKWQGKSIRSFIRDRNVT